MTKIWIILSILFSAASAYSTEPTEKAFQLNYSYQLKVMEQEDLSTVVEINVDEQTYHIDAVESSL